MGAGIRRRPDRRLERDMSMRRCAAGLAALGASLTLAACGGGSNDTTSTAAAGGDSAARQAKLQEAALKFTRCMRRHGIDMPDPKAGQGGGGFTIGGPGADIDPDDPAFQRAQTACEKILEEARPQLTPEQRAEQQEQALKFARCMREHGIDIPDPVFSDRGGFSVRRGRGRSGGRDSNIDPDDPKFQAAQKECGRPFGATTERRGR
jgi:hypothetical protein